MLRCGWGASKLRQVLNVLYPFVLWGVPLEHPEPPLEHPDSHLEHPEPLLAVGLESWIFCLKERI